jgi:hypothetical protein
MVVGGPVGDETTIAAVTVNPAGLVGAARCEMTEIART